MPYKISKLNSYTVVINKLKLIHLIELRPFIWEDSLDPRFTWHTKYAQMPYETQTECVCNIECVGHFQM